MTWMDAGHFNRMLDGRIRDLAKVGGCVPAQSRREELLRCLGLSPLPPRTDLRAAVTRSAQFEGYRVEAIRYESRPGLLVTADLYLPDGPGPHPVILNPHGHWEYKKSTPVVQARGISLALEGFAAMVIESPGWS